MSKFGSKNALFGYFWGIISKTIVIFEISTLEFVKNESLTHTVNFGVGSAFSKAKKQKCLNLGPRMPYLGIFRVEFQKTNVIFEISTLELSNCKVSRKNKKCLNLGPKMPYLVIFRLELQKTIAIFEISTLEFV